MTTGDCVAFHVGAGSILFDASQSDEESGGAVAVSGLSDCPSFGGSDYRDQGSFGYRARVAAIVWASGGLVRMTQQVFPRSLKVCPLEDPMIQIEEASSDG